MSRLTNLLTALLGVLTRAGAAIGSFLQRAPVMGSGLSRTATVRQEAVGARLAAGPAGVLRRPRVATAVAVVAVIVAVLAVSRLEAGAPPSLLADDGSRVSQATKTLESSFGGEPIVVLVRGEMTDQLTKDSLTRLKAMEDRLAGLEGVRSVFGPGTFVTQTIEQFNKVIGQEIGSTLEQADAAGARARAAAKRRGATVAVQQRLGEQARSAALGNARGQVEQLQLRFGGIGQPSLDNVTFLQGLVLGAQSTPKERFNWVFADRTHSIIAVRPLAGVSDAELQSLGRQMQRVVSQTKIPNLTFTVAGSPLVVSALTDELQSEMPRIAPAALLAMALVLLIGLGVAWRSLATLVPAGIAVLLTAALSWLLGLGLTPATIAALPVILGLTIDYAVQLQARYRGVRDDGAEPAEAVRRATTTVGPVLLLAAGVMIVGFLTLTLSSVPLIDRLGLTLAFGTACGLATALVLTGPLLALRDRGVASPPELRVPVLSIPRRLRGVLVLLAVAVPVAGIALTGQTTVESDVQKLAPSGMEELENVETLQSELGTAGQLRISVRSNDITDPAVLDWMGSLQERAAAIDSRLKPGPNVAELLLSGAQGTELTPTRARRLLTLVPPAFLTAALTPDRTRAEVSLGMPLLDADEQAEIIERLQPLLDDAPEGTTAEVGGLIGLSASSVQELESGRPWLLLGAALVIFLILLGVRRRVDRALMPLLPALVTAGVSTLFVAVSGLKLSPLSAGLEPLVLAVGVEFGLLLEARYREARRDGHDPAEAAQLAGRLVGAPVAVAAATVAAGFAVLGASRLGVLQQFGLLAAAELLFCAAVAVLLVPPLAAAWDRHRARRESAPDGTVRVRPLPAGARGAG